MRQRRFLPSIKLLLALDAVVRHGSVTAAATELNLTQSTVSRLILSLEEQLGRELFTRERRRLIPNAAAISYQRDIARALDMVQRASMSAVANSAGGTLSLAVLPTFATRWLGPQLGRFLTAHPGVALNMSTRYDRVDFATEAYDAAIYFGDGDWPRVNHLKLFDEQVTACVSPEFRQRHRLDTPQDLAALPMLQLETRPTAWADWFRGQGQEPVGAGGMLMDQFSMMIQAAISGLGIALLPDYLARIEIAENRLVPVFRQAVPTSGAYWLVWPDGNDQDTSLALFRDWLSQNASGASG
ncbi:LysR family transcriptional regulator [Paracoccus sp. SCSIO 75233]|uniref:LysR family transcriptional regulator n=1 Tax=Paracoccus sp. SCSIO 75233 TaxID=3017782 RepID=UPI0022F0DB0C|nr:LysR family transcriptional regulator [Paracoccus sp. SCSIO 75233]WBU53095.1 LysR family transcriptional regulator [Paracoccus sp. SCSIO 75233]